MITTEHATVIAPRGAICSRCTCLMTGERAIVVLEYDSIARCELPTYRHSDAADCAAARVRSAAWWREDDER